METLINFMLVNVKENRMILCVFCGVSFPYMCVGNRHCKWAVYIVTCIDKYRNITYLPVHMHLYISVGGVYYCHMHL